MNYSKLARVLRDPRVGVLVEITEPELRSLMQWII